MQISAQLHTIVASLARHARARLSRGFWARLRAHHTLSLGRPFYQGTLSAGDVAGRHHAPRVRLLQES